MLRAFGQRHREANTAAARVTTWLSIAGDTIVSASGAHGDLLRQDVRTSLRNVRADTGLLAAYTSWSTNLLGAGEPARVDGALVTRGIFAVLGVPPAMGRTLTAVDDRLDAPRTVVISHALWQSQFAGRTDILGQSVLLDDEPHAVGVMPASSSWRGSGTRCRCSRHARR